MKEISILGAGAFGTALAIALASDGRKVRLWGRDATSRSDMSANRENRVYLPGIEFPKSIEIANSVEDASRSPIVLLSVPTQALGQFLDEFGHFLHGKTLVTCCKGIDLITGTGPTAVLQQAIPDAVVAVLTGPSFAADIAAGLPTALTLATSHSSYGPEMQVALSGRTLRIYLSDDPIGAEFGGAVKNVIALAAGLTLGSGLGESARAAVITRGFAEMQRLAEAIGARPETLQGLSGLGDLILTCTSEKSRNLSAGLALGRAQPLPTGTTIEGLATAKAVSNLAEKHKIDMPVSTMVAAVVSGETTIDEARDALLTRPLRKE